ncbi:MarR family winged helix-turn-helix transcriptional regulator [Streptomyces zingiberis]|uniref:Winged helix-turn-helix transcriptional regulator n=1 Tax=Streptomyces zingiberis TaxID=2053010 RepID=A0ABX1BXU6_9ACTN|nr:MarR family winged helix-turn-helix transcriptional regulator [Streptomyces zingiberis]NJQ00547.1 winged helix-turn-helix transcriptional regulator [Streptomyces zingiberis]
MDAPLRRLTPEQSSAWYSFIRMQEKLLGRLTRRVQADSGLSASDYIVLAKLTESGGRMRSMDLAKLVEWEKSRVSHQVRRMTNRGLVTKEECADDGRGAFIVVTGAGYRAIEEAAPIHAGHVHRLFVEALTPEELATLARLSQRVLAHMETHPD